MRTVVQVAREDGLLEAAERVRAAASEGELVLVVPEGAPVLANPLFLRVLGAERPDRAIALVTPDLRGRAMASGCHVPAYASLAAHEQRSLDATEPLERARRSAVAEIGRERELSRARRRRLFAIGALALVLLLVIGPSAEVLVSADVTPVGPLELEVRAAPAGAVPGTRLVATVQRSIDASATGTRIERSSATGVARFTNASTDRIEIPAGTIVSTAANVQFRTTQARTLAPSAFFPLFISEVQVPVVAVQPGTGGNVPRGSLTRVSDQRLRVTNDQATSGGDEKPFPLVQASDYATASGKLDQALEDAARAQLRAWMADPPPGYRVEEKYAFRSLARTGNTEVVGKEIATFQVAGSWEVSAYAVAEHEPRSTALRRLVEAAKTGYELVPESASIEVSAIEVGADALVWRVKARASQRPQLDEGALRLTLAGRDPSSAAPLLAQRGLRLVEMRAFPSWWPRLPFLPLRIDIRQGALAAVGR